MSDNLPVKAEPVELQPAVDNGEVWERVKGESRQAFGNFAYFRDLGRERSLPKAAAGLEKSLATMKEQSAKYRWQERADSYTDYLDRRDRQELESARSKVNEEHMALARRIQLIVGRRLIGDQSNPRQPISAIDPNDLDAAELARLLELSWRIQRTATGQPTDFVAGKFGISAEDLLKITQGLYDIAERLLPEERRGRLAVEFQAFLERGGLS